MVDGQVMCAAWLRFEREQGSLEDYDHAVAKVTPPYHSALHLYSSTYLSIYLPLYLSTYLYIYLPVYPPVCLLSCTSFYLSEESATHRDTRLAPCTFRRSLLAWRR